MHSLQKKCLNLSSNAIFAQIYSSHLECNIYLKEFKNNFTSKVMFVSRIEIISNVLFARTNIQFFSPNAIFALKNSRYFKCNICLSAVFKCIVCNKGFTSLKKSTG